MKLVLTCEHAGNLIPDNYKYLFIDSIDVLETHRGYDPGALDLYQHLEQLATYTTANKVSRLLIEVNRSLHHPSLFSEFTINLPSEDKDKLIEDYYLPYRTDVEKAIAGFITTGEEVLHLSIHSFTPQLDGQVRNADIGLLYDPNRKTEKEFCKALKRDLQFKKSSYRIRSNYPYRGTADGFTTSLRKIFPEKYTGIEIEVNQKCAVKNKMDPGLKKDFLASLKTLMIKK